MRTTLVIDDDVLAAAKRLAATQRKSVGEVISALARQALQPGPETPSMRNGIPLLSARPGTMQVTLELMNQMRDELT